MRQGVDSFDTTFTDILCRYLECDIQMFVLAASVSPPANVKPTSVLSIVVTRESRNYLRGSSIKNGIEKGSQSSMSFRSSFSSASAIVVRLSAPSHMAYRTQHNHSVGTNCNFARWKWRRFSFDSDARCPIWRHTIHSRRSRGAWCGSPRVRGSERDAGVFCWRYSKCTKVWRHSMFVLWSKYFFSFFCASIFCRFAISGWLSQAVKSANANTVT